MATAATPGDDGVAPSASLEGIPTNVTDKRKRSGGPRTARGKEISAKNSTPNGVEDDNSVGIPPSAVVFHPICREVVPYEAGGASM